MAVLSNIKLPGGLDNLNIYENLFSYQFIFKNIFEDIIPSLDKEKLGRYISDFNPSFLEQAIVDGSDENQFFQDLIAPLLEKYGEALLSLMSLR